jgi:hypothetical protein
MIRSDTVTIGVLCLFIGLAIQPYVYLAFEWWLTRPKRMDPFDIHDICKECDNK